METINLSEIKRLILEAQRSLAIALHAIETKVLIGEINRPEPPKPRRNRRKKAEIEAAKGTSDSGRFRDVPPVEHAEKFPETLKSLSEDKSPFYVKPKKGRKKKVAPYEPTDEGIE